MKQVKTEIWSRDYSFNGTNLQVLQDNLPNPCVLVYFDDEVVLAEDGNVKTAEEWKLYHEKQLQDHEVAQQQAASENEELNAKLDYVMMMVG